MSQLLVDDIVNKDDSGSPGFSKGAVVTGIVTATTLKGTTVEANTIAAGATGDLKLRDSVVVTVYARNIGKDLFQ